MNTQELIALKERTKTVTLYEQWTARVAEVVQLKAELEDLTGALLDTRRDRDAAEAEVKELKIIIAKTLKDIDALMEYIRGR